LFLFREEGVQEGSSKQIFTFTDILDLIVIEEGGMEIGLSNSKAALFRKNRDDDHGEG
jgi:hypothetical protein